jgi:hypothetical protein
LLHTLQPNLFTVTDASGDDSPATVFQHGVLNVNFSLPPIIPGIIREATLVAEPTVGGPSIDLKTYSTATQADDLINLYESDLTTLLAPGRYVLGLRVEFRVYYYSVWPCPFLPGEEIHLKRLRAGKKGVYFFLRDVTNVTQIEKFVLPGEEPDEPNDDYIPSIDHVQPPSKNSLYNQNSGDES